ncbi:MAG: phospho-sugar mutase, partial [Pseudobutyrivibrio sp.]|nr:phospho-sugar mutase [Pseudobutyrivibrio sp.]
MDYNSRYEEWLKQLEDTDPLKAELKDIAGDEKEKEDRFYQDLSFGTAGLRGKVGAGTNRMNFFTVGKATQGVADFIVSKGQEAM